MCHNASVGSIVLLSYMLPDDAAVPQSLLQMNVAHRHSVSRSLSPDGPNGRGQM